MRKTSLAEKKSKGTLQKCRIKHPPAYENLISIPDPAFELDINGKMYFDKFCQMLIDNKLLTAAYVPIISRAARYFEIYKDADDKVQSNGIVQIAEKSGWEQKSAYFTIMTDAEDRITKIEEKFGMTLLSMQKLDIKKPDKNADDDDFS